MADPGSKNLYVKMKELGPLRGDALGAPPWIRQLIKYCCVAVRKQGSGLQSAFAGGVGTKLVKVIFFP